MPCPSTRIIPRLGTLLVLASAMLVVAAPLASCGNGGDSKARDAAKAHALKLKKSTKAEKRLYGELGDIIGVTATDVDDAQDEIGAPKGDVPSHVHASVIAPAVISAGAGAEANASNSAKDARRHIRQLPRTWRSYAGDLAGVGSPAVVTRYRRAYRATMAYLRDAERFLSSGVAFMKGWNKLTYIQELYLLSDQWERYKESAGTEASSGKRARRALRSAHRSFRRGLAS